MSKLTERLRKIEHGSGVADMVSNWYRNPDGPEAADRIERLEGALRALIIDITDKEHSPHDWSEQVCVKNARAALEES